MSLESLGAVFTPSPVYGSDVYGKNWDERHLLPARLDFLIVKASEGTYDVDPHRDDWLAFARQRKIPVSLYHFGRSGSPAEVAFALRAARGVKKLWLDLDDQDGQPTMPLKDVLPFLRQARAAGKDVGLYVDGNVLDQLIATLGPNERAELATYKLWIATYHADRQPTKGLLLPPLAFGVYGNRWSVWQYSDGGASGIDLDVSWDDEVATWGSWWTPGRTIGVAAAVAGVLAAALKWLL